MTNPTNDDDIDQPRPRIATLEELEAEQERVRRELGEEDWALLTRVGEPIGGDE